MMIRTRAQAIKKGWEAEGRGRGRGRGGWGEKSEGKKFVQEEK